MFKKFLEWLFKPEQEIVQNANQLTIGDWAEQ